MSNTELTKKVVCRKSIIESGIHLCCEAARDAAEVADRHRENSHGKLIHLVLDKGFGQRAQMGLTTGFDDSRRQNEDRYVHNTAYITAEPASSPAISAPHTY